jgi:hypothetical protein
MHTFLIRVVKIGIWNDVVIGDNLMRDLCYGRQGKTKRKAIAFLFLLFS